MNPGKHFRAPESNAEYLGRSASPSWWTAVDRCHRPQRTISGYALGEECRQDCYGVRHDDIVLKYRLLQCRCGIGHLPYLHRHTATLLWAASSVGGQHDTHFSGTGALHKRHSSCTKQQQYQHRKGYKNIGNPFHFRRQKYTII